MEKLWRDLSDPDFYAYLLRNGLCQFHMDLYSHWIHLDSIIELLKSSTAYSTTSQLQLSLNKFYLFIHFYLQYLFYFFSSTAQY